MGNASIVEAVVDRLNQLSTGEQQEILNFAAIIMRRHVASDGLRMTEAEIDALLHWPTRTLEESFAEFEAKYQISDLSHLTDDERDALLDAEIAALGPEKIATARAIGLL